MDSVGYRSEFNGYFCLLALSPFLVTWSIFSKFLDQNENRLVPEPGSFSCLALSILLFF